MRARVCVYERLNWVFFKRFIDSCNLLSPPLSTFHKRSIAFRCLLCTGIDANRDPPHLSSDRTRHRPAHQPHGFGAWALGLLPQCKHPLFSQHTTCSTWIQQSSTCRSPLPSTCSHSLFPGMIHRHPAKPPLFSCVLCPANNAGSYSIVSLPNPLDTGNMHVCMCMYAFCVAVIPVAPLCFVLSFTFGGLRRRMADGCLPFQHHTYLHGHVCYLPLQLLQEKAAQPRFLVITPQQPPQLQPHRCRQHHGCALSQLPIMCVSSLPSPAMRFNLTHYDKRALTACGPCFNAGSDSLASQHPSGC